MSSGFTHLFIQSLNALVPNRPIGVLTLSQFGIGVLSVSQFTIAGFALAQVALAYSLIAQVGLCFHEGHGQVVRNLMDLI
ncbi:MAG: hypothetical protein ABIG42_00410 [bacterium]